MSRNRNPPRMFSSAPGACAHPLLATTAADVLSTLAAHSQPALGGRLVAAVARLAGLAAAAEAAAAVAVAVGAAAAAAGPAAGAGTGAGAVGGVEGTGVARRLERLLACMIAVSVGGGWVCVCVGG